MTRWPVLEQVFREDAGCVLGSLIGWLGDIELAEDAVQDAVMADMNAVAPNWPASGVAKSTEFGCQLGAGESRQVLGMA
jgi:predicted RNA polymerase sigma factor